MPVTCDPVALGKHTFFTGALSPKQYAPKLAALDIGVAPYCGATEFAGLKSLDYKAAGLAIIASGNMASRISFVTGLQA